MAKQQALEARTAASTAAMASKQSVSTKNVPNKSSEPRSANNFLSTLPDGEWATTLPTIQTVPPDPDPAMEEHDNKTTETLATSIGPKFSPGSLALAREWLCTGQCMGSLEEWEEAAPLLALESYRMCQHARKMQGKYMQHVTDSARFQYTSQPAAATMEDNSQPDPFKEPLAKKTKPSAPAQTAPTKVTNHVPAKTTVHEAAQKPLPLPANKDPDPAMAAHKQRLKATTPATVPANNPDPDPAIEAHKQRLQATAPAIVPANNPDPAIEAH